MSRFVPSVRQMRAFLAVHQLRKLRAAAERLFVTQSTVSVLVRQLEEGLRVRLFDRTTRSLQTTPAGEEAAVVIERILRDVDLLGAGAAGLSALTRGRVSVAITPTLAGMLLPLVLPDFRRDYPGVGVQVDDCAPDQFLSRVVGGHVDFGIGTPERAGGEVDLVPLMRDVLCVVCHVDHPLASARSVRWRDLAGHAVIAGRPGYGVRPLVDLAASRAGVTLNIVNEVSFLSTALWLAQAGEAAAILPSAYASAPAHPDLVILPLLPRVSRDVFVVTQHGRSLSPAAERFLVSLRTALRARNGSAWAGHSRVPGR